MEVDLSVVEPKHHELNIIFDPAKKSVVIKFDVTEFGTWEYILGILEMAKIHASFMRSQSLMIQQAQAQAQMQQAQQLVRNIR